MAERGFDMNVTNDPLQYDDAILIECCHSPQLRNRLIELLDSKIKFFDAADSCLEGLDHNQSQYYRELANQLCPLYVFILTATYEISDQIENIEYLASKGHRMIVCVEGPFLDNEQILEMRRNLSEYRSVVFRESIGGAAEVITEMFKYGIRAWYQMQFC